MSNQQFAKVILDEVPDDVVYFKLMDKDGNEMSVRGTKSHLRSLSTVFDSMFNETWTKTTVPISDDFVTFDQYATFRRFMELIYGLNQVKNLNIAETCNVYFYAHKYQTLNLMSALPTHLIATLPRAPLELHQLVGCIELAETYSLQDVLETVDTVQIAIKQENCLEFYKVCKESNMDKLMAKVTSFAANTELDATWPIDLIVRIANHNRNEVNNLKNQATVNQTKTCRNCGRANFF